MDTTSVISGLAVTILIAIALFFILRSVMLWYWRINHIIEALEKQANLNQIQINLLTLMAAKAGVKQSDLQNVFEKDKALKKPLKISELY